MFRNHATSEYKHNRFCYAPNLGGITKSQKLLKAK